jgi:hypothetical protein
MGHLLMENVDTAHGFLSVDLIRLYVVKLGDLADVRLGLQDLLHVILVHY